jgi:hypothetical protein
LYIEFYLLSKIPRKHSRVRPFSRLHGARNAEDLSNLFGLLHQRHANFLLQTSSELRTHIGDAAFGNIFSAIETNALDFYAAGN